MQHVNKNRQSSWNTNRLIYKHISEFCPDVPRFAWVAAVVVIVVGSLFDVCSLFP